MPSVWEEARKKKGWQKKKKKKELSWEMKHAAVEQP